MDEPNGQTSTGTNNPYEALTARVWYHQGTSDPTTTTSAGTNYQLEGDEAKGMRSDEEKRGRE